MRYFIFFCLVLGLLFFLSTSQTFAGDNSLQVNISNPIRANNIQGLIEAIIDALVYLAFFVVPIVVIIAGFYYITSAGNPEKIKNAQNAVLYAIVGLIIVLLARGIIELIRTVLGIT